MKMHKKERFCQFVGRLPSAQNHAWHNKCKWGRAVKLISDNRIKSDTVSTPINTKYCLLLEFCNLVVVGV